MLKIMHAGIIGGCLRRVPNVLCMWLATLTLHAVQLYNYVTISAELPLIAH